MAGSAVMPASTSATCRAVTLAALALQLARHVEQAAEVAREQHVGAGGGDRGGLLLDDRVGDVGIFHAERAAEPAADVGVRELPDLQSVDRAQQLPRLLADLQFAQAGTGVVVGDAAVERRFDAGHAAHVDEEADQLVRLGGKGIRPGCPRRVVAEQGGVVRVQHPGARAGRRHDVVEILEGRDGLARDRLGVFAVAGVIRRLSAAGLRRRHLDRAAALLRSA